MPIYQYKCSNCGANIERMQSFSADPLVDCPECHQPTLKRVMQATGIIFKGSGWYITDSKKSSSSAVTSSGDGASGESKPEAKTEAKTETKTKTESKPESKAESSSTPAPSTSS
jgi:putative FmdB family regulatory protein